jgi:hypothetical protein
MSPMADPTKRKSSAPHWRPIDDDAMRGDLVLIRGPTIGVVDARWGRFGGYWHHGSVMISPDLAREWMPYPGSEGEGA